MRLKDKVVIATGASRGVGVEAMSMFAAEGARVVLVTRSAEEMEQLRQSINRQGEEGICVSMDIRSREGMKNMVKIACNAYGATDILVDNAGCLTFGYAVDDGDEEAEKQHETTMKTSVRGYWYGVRFTVPYMKEGSRGSIINIPLIKGHLGLANETAHCTAKGTVKVMTEALAVEPAPYNTRVNCISPGVTQVKVGHWVSSRCDQEIYDEYVEKFRDIHLLGMGCSQPLRMIGESRDVGYTVVYLVSEEARSTTGSDIVVDGGLTSLLPEPGALGMETLTALHGKQGPINQQFQSSG